MRILILIKVLLFSTACLYAQEKEIEMGVTMKQYIKENHLDQIESIIHGLADSKIFLQQFIEDEENLNANIGRIKRKDVKVGGDVDIEVRHFSEHQTFTMVLVPISIYNMAIYDTLLFSVLEVSDQWLEREFPYEEIKNDSVRSSLLSLKNHDLLAAHLYERALSGERADVGRFRVHLHESYISTNTIHEHIKNLEKSEKASIRAHWGLIKKALSHNIDLNVEFNIYVFGFNDLEVKCNIKGEAREFKITPGNVFQRHHFQK